MNLPRRKLKVFSIICISILILGILFLILFDWNLLRDPIAKYVSKKTGREFVINGNFDIDFFPLEIEAQQIKLANENWSTSPQMMEIENLKFGINFLSLFKKRLALPEVILSKPKIILEKNNEGVPNWVFEKNAEGNNERLPIIRQLVVDQGVLLYRDPTIKTDLTINLATIQNSTDDMGVQIHAEGIFKNMPTKANGNGGKIISLWSETLPYPLNATVRIGETRADINGVVTGLISFAAIDAKLNVKGNDMADLFPIIGISLPPTPPYQIAGRLIHASNDWEYKNFNGRVGDSDLSGDVVVRLNDKRPFLQAKLASKLLDLDDLGGFIGAPPQTGSGETASSKQRREAGKKATSSKALPDKEFRLERLTAMDADVELKGVQIRRGKALPIENLTAHLKLNDGQLTLEPLNFGVAGGNITSTVFMNAKQAPISVDANVQFRKLKLNKLFPTIKLTKESTGQIGGRAELKSSGNSFAKLVGSANGAVGLSMSGGEVSNLLLELIGIDGGEIIKFLLRGDKNVTVRCAVMDFKVTDGLMKTNIFVIDTSDTNILGEGNVNMADETLNLTLRPLPKDKSILSFRGPLNVNGTFKNPSFSPDMGALTAKGGGAILLGSLLGPVAALIPLIEMGPGKDSDCRALIAEVNSKK